MNDPHVETLTYQIESTGPHSYNYDNAEPLSRNLTGIGEFSIKKGVLTVKLTAHYSDEQMACHCVEPYLRSWEIHNDLVSNYGEIRFRFVNSVVVDRNPSPQQPLEISVSSQIGISASVSITAIARRYPDPPPPTFAVANSLVEEAHWRWSRYKEGRESLHSMAYFVLTLIENEGAKDPGNGGKRLKASRKFNIAKGVLDEIGYISSEAGTAQSARKATGTNIRYVPSGASNKEAQRINSQLDNWLAETIAQVILRIGFHSTSPSSKQLALSDLPQLPSVAP